MASPSFSLEGKVAIVTGASRGIGKSIALAFAEAGADVVICSRTLADLEKVAEEITALGRRALAVSANVAIKADIDKLMEKAVQEFGTIDILVNNAGMNIMVPLLELREDGWDKVLNTNLKGCYLCSQAVAKVMVERKKGNIINMTSVAGRFPAHQLGAYSIAKAGVVMLTRVLAVELAPHNIRVNAIGPGLVRTELGAPLLDVPEISKLLEVGIPMKRIAEPEEIVGAALFLASDASSYVTGQTIYVDGGIPA